MWQSEHVAGELKRLYPQCELRILGITTRGDQIVDRPLAQIGGKGLFVKELEAALEDGRADLAVHSAKDVPMRLPQGFCLAAFTAREDPRDCLVSNASASLEALPSGSIVGTSSLRRESQLRERHPALQVKPLRGNLDTRLAKLDRGVRGRERRADPSARARGPARRQQGGARRADRSDRRARKTG